MNEISKLLIIGGFLLILFGLIWEMGGRFGFGNLPGDIRIEKENFKFYFPLSTSLVISAIISLLIWIFLWLRK
jgi:hypothetical protein